MGVHFYFILKFAPHLARQLHELHQSGVLSGNVFDEVASLTF
jgi:hypothetical protein